ncbi:Phospholipase A1 member A [Acipenser ruthenus]|uniref:Phospholipase A1 member A n=1 Tax=Acipenser ruthenus TaxID=7906 RepID=A0A444UFG7_ACIRT|nr:Phospholipase A1 member A [Acipenser ruthenus]
MQIQYLIFTSRNRNCASIVTGGSIEEIQATNFSSFLDTKVIVLGYRQKGVTGFKMVMAHSTMLCKIDSIELKNTGTRFYRKDEINIVKICISEVPSDRKESLCIENIELKEGNPWSHDFVKLCN